MRRSTSLAIVLFVFMTSCAPAYITEDELKKYLLNSDHGLTKEVLIEDYKVRVAFKPTDLLIAQELGSSSNVEQIAKLRHKYEGHYYFVLSLSRNKHEAIQAGTMPQDQFSELLQIISFRLNAYVNMTTPRQDTIPLADFLYDRTFGMGMSNDILLVFNKKETANQEWIQINLAEFGLGLGTRSIQFNLKNLEEIPAIDFTNRIQ